jgi:hypothetical protein
MERVQKADQDDLMEAALSLLDRARRVAQATYGDRILDADQATVVALQLAVQTVFQCELVDRRKIAGGTFVEFDPREIAARFYGLGSAIGQCLGSVVMGGPEFQRMMLDAVTTGTAEAVAIRNASTREEYRPDDKGDGR